MRLLACRPVFHLDIVKRVSTTHLMYLYMGRVYCERSCPMKVVKVLTLVAVGATLAACAQQQQQHERKYVVWNKNSIDTHYRPHTHDYLTR